MSGGYCVEDVMVCEARNPSTLGDIYIVHGDVTGKKKNLVY